MVDKILAGGQQRISRKGRRFAATLLKPNEPISEPENVFPFLPQRPSKTLEQKVFFRESS
jgi:hypothetical protein